MGWSAAVTLPPYPGLKRGGSRRPIEGEESTVVVGKQWSNETMVWVTDWGHAVHNNPSCHGIAAFGSKDKSMKVRLDNRLCAVRRACKKCFGEYYGVYSLRALDRLIETLHGKVDIDQQARTLIATTARLRFGDGNARPPAKGRAVTSKRSSASAVVSSSGRAKPPKPAPKQKQSKPSSPKQALSKAEAKRRRDRAAASQLGITVEELRARRRQENEARARQR